MQPPDDTQKQVNSHRENSRVNKGWLTISDALRQCRVVSTMKVILRSITAKILRGLSLKRLVLERYCRK